MAKNWRKIEMSPAWKFEDEKELIGVFKGKEEKIATRGALLMKK